MTLTRICAALGFVVSISLAGPAAAVNKSKAEQQFRQWQSNVLWPKAKKAGVSRRTFQAALKGVKLDWSMPEIVPPGTRKSPPKKQYQSEFRQPGAYFNQRSLNILAQRGGAQIKRFAKTLTRIEKKYGVPKEIIVAIWGRESGFGRVKMPKNAVAALATSAFMGWRKELFERELIAALKIIDKGHISAKAMGSSWAGALGQPQFLPSKFGTYAVDFDGDGKRNIWTSAPDTLASIANYLARHGWQSGRDWGFEARIPASLSCSFGGPDQDRTIGAWNKKGAKRISGRAFPANEMRGKGYLLFPAGRFGPTFVTTPNFYVLKAYNESDLYALFVGHLADRMRGGGAFKTKWQKLPTFSRAAVKSMQDRLIAQGYDVGGADGLVGYKTRTAIGMWQEKQGQKATCFPSRALVKRLR
ncbi:MAG: lytic murein transglycosylase [Pseudomonadota bacterium]